MLNNLSIRKKLALIALGPLILLTALAALQITTDLGDSSGASDTQSRVTVSALTGQLFDAVRDEAVENQNAVAISGLDLEGVRADTDAAIERWNAAATKFSSLDGGELANVVGDFNAHRADIAATFATELGASAVFEADTEILRTIAAFDGRLTAGAKTEAAALRRAADLTSVSATTAELQLLGMWAANAKAVPGQLSESIGAATNAADTFGLRTATELPVAEGSYDTLVAEFSGLSAGDVVGVSANDWRAASDARAVQLSNARATEVAAASTAALDAQNTAQRAMQTAGLLLLAGLLLGLGAAFLVAKAISSALRGLRDEASQLADHDLPRIADALSTGAPIERIDTTSDDEVPGDDEFGEVAAGLVAIRKSAAGLGDRVAVLQGGIADTYVNLARRNQSLVDRQLEAIDTLEAQERDPDRLALMYRVDHLATRMRRNAESLLVLADAKTPERHSAAVSLREVLRVAIGEVEDYRRIIPIALDELPVAGHRAQDLAHLLAELMENAAQHSPPGTAVDVSGAVERSTGDYLITILDHGTGIEAEQLQVLNTLLQTPPNSTLTISHSIGLHVVSRLADTLSLQVRLHQAEGGRTLSTIRVPANVAAEWSQTAVGASVTAAVVAAPVPAPENPMVSSTPPAQFTPPPMTPVPEPTQAVVPPSVVFPDVDLPIEPTQPFSQHEPTPAMDLADPMTLKSVGDLMSADDVVVPDPPAVPTIDMPGLGVEDLELPSLGTFLESDLADPEPATEAHEIVEPISDPFAEIAGDVAFSEVDTPTFTPTALAVFPSEHVAPEPPPSDLATLEPFIRETFTPPPMPVAGAETALPEPDVTSVGLVRRQRQSSESIPRVDLQADRTAPSQRTPDQVKNMLSRYKTGLERGRGAAGTDGE